MMSQKSVPVLAYWDIRCLAESIRLMLEYLGVEFIDKKYPTGDPPNYDRKEWKSDKESLGFDFPNLPYFIHGNIKLTESWAIMKHIGRKYSLYPETEAQDMRCDIAQGCIEQFRYEFIDTCYSTSTSIFQSRKANFLLILPQTLDNFERFIGNSLWLAGEKLTYVDFALCEVLDQIGMFQPDFLEKHEMMKQYLARFDSLKSIVDYRNSIRYHNLPINSKYAYWGGANKL